MDRFLRTCVRICVEVKTNMACILTVFYRFVPRVRTEVDKKAFKYAAPRSSSVHVVFCCCCNSVFMLTSWPGVSWKRHFNLRHFVVIGKAQVFLITLMMHMFFKWASMLSTKKWKQLSGIQPSFILFFLLWHIKMSSVKKVCDSWWFSWSRYFKNPAHPHRCFHLFWMTGGLLGLKSHAGTKLHALITVIKV